MPLDLEWHGLRYTVKTPKGDLEVLKGISGAAKSGRMLAVLGGSGGGKSTLIDVLADRKAVGTAEGAILLNGRPIPSRAAWKRMTGYVQQHDQLMATATVMEALMFSIQLRTAYGTPLAEQRQKVEELLREMKLDHRKNAYIGGENLRSLSGGEMRRVSIAQELVADVDVLFLDEPTSGLDSTTARSIVALMSDMCRSKDKIVLASVHQPSSQIMTHFDDIVLLSKGRVCYFGPWSRAVEHLEAIGQPCPQYTNPADHLLDITFHEDIVDLMVEHAYDSADVDRTTSEVTRLDKLAPSDTSDAPLTPFWLQLRVVWVRAARQWWRDPLILYSELAQYVFVGLFIGAMYYDLSDDLNNGTFDRLSAVFFILTSLVFVPSFTIITSMGAELPLARRETGAGMYSLWASFLAKIGTTWVFELFLGMLFCVCVYWLAGLLPGADTFLVFYVIVAVVLLLAETIGLLCAVATPNPTVGVLLLSLVLLIALALGGFLVSEPRNFYAWTEHVNFFVYAFTAITLNQFDGLKLINETGAEVDALEMLRESGRIRNDLSVGENIAVLVAMLVAFRLAAFALLKRKLIRSTYKRNPMASGAVVAKKSTTVQTTTDSANVV